MSQKKSCDPDDTLNSDPRILFQQKNVKSETDENRNIHNGYFYHFRKVITQIYYPGNYTAKNYDP